MLFVKHGCCRGWKRGCGGSSSSGSCQTLSSSN